MDRYSQCAQAKQEGDDDFVFARHVHLAHHESWQNRQADIGEQIDGVEELQNDMAGIGPEASPLGSILQAMPIEGCRAALESGKAKIAGHADDCDPSQDSCNQAQTRRWSQRAEEDGDADLDAAKASAEAELSKEGVLAWY